MRGHPVHTVIHELQRHGQGTEFPLGSLSEAGVATYLAQRFGEAALPAGLARVLQHRTNGNPFFWSPWWRSRSARASWCRRPRVDPPGRSGNGGGGSSRECAAAH